MPGWPEHAALAGGIALAAAYALFSGWSVPAQRTVLMLAAVGLLRLWRHWPWPWVWLFACAAVVPVDRASQTQAGFWLSFVAVGVLFVQRREGMGRSPRGGRRRGARGCWWCAAAAPSRRVVTRWH